MADPAVVGRPRTSLDQLRLRTASSRRMAQRSPPQLPDRPRLNAGCRLFSSTGERIVLPIPDRRAQTGIGSGLNRPRQSIVPPKEGGISMRIGESRKRSEAAFKTISKRRGGLLQLEAR